MIGSFCSVLKFLLESVFYNLHISLMYEVLPREARGMQTREARGM